MLRRRELKGVRRVRDARDGESVHVADLGVEIDPVAELRHVLPHHLDDRQVLPEGRGAHGVLVGGAGEALQRCVELCLLQEQHPQADLADPALQVGQAGRLGLGGRLGADEVVDGERGAGPPPGVG